MSNIYSSCLILTILIVFTSCESKTRQANNTPWEDSTTNFQSDKLENINTQIRKEKFDLIIPSAMRKHKIDMWIHVMRDALPDLNIQKTIFLALKILVAHQVYSCLRIVEENELKGQ